MNSSGSTSWHRSLREVLSRLKSAMAEIWTWRGGTLGRGRWTIYGRECWGCSSSKTTVFSRPSGQPGHRPSSWQPSGKMLRGISKPSTVTRPHRHSGSSSPRDKNAIIHIITSFSVLNTLYTTRHLTEGLLVPRFDRGVYKTGVQMRPEVTSRPHRAWQQLARMRPFEILTSLGSSSNIPPSQAVWNIFSCTLLVRVRKSFRNSQANNNQKTTTVRGAVA